MKQKQTKNQNEPVGIHRQGKHRAVSVKIPIGGYRQSGLMIRCLSRDLSAPLDYLSTYLSH